MFVDVGLHFARSILKVQMESGTISKILSNIYFNLLINSHEGAWFHKKSFSRPIDIVVKEAALRVDDYYLLCDIFGLPTEDLLY